MTLSNTWRPFVFVEQFRKKFFLTLIKLQTVPTACFHSSLVLTPSSFFLYRVICTNIHVRVPLMTFPGEINVPVWVFRRTLRWKLWQRPPTSACSAGSCTASTKPWTGPSAREPLSLASWTLLALKSSRYVGISLLRCSFALFCGLRTRCRGTEGSQVTRGVDLGVYKGFGSPKLQCQKVVI